VVVLSREELLGYIEERVQYVVQVLYAGQACIDVELVRGRKCYRPPPVPRVNPVANGLAGNAHQVGRYGLFVIGVSSTA
jgi:hypothetical protein